MRRGGRSVPKLRRPRSFIPASAPAPTLTKPADQESPTGVPVELQLVFSNTTSFTIGAIPAGILFNTITGKFTGTPTTEEQKIISVTAHGAGGEVEVKFVWAIVKTAVPTITSPGPQVGRLEENVDLGIVATNATSFSATSLPPGLSINFGTGVISGELSAEGTYFPKITAMGPGGSASVTFEWIVHAFPYGLSNANTVAQEIYGLIEPLTYADQGLGFPLLKYLDGIGLMWNDIDEIIRDKIEPHGKIRPGYAKVMTVGECPENWLPWLAQFIGVTAPPNMPVLDQELIIAASGMNRGTPAAIKAAVAVKLTGAKRVDLFERSEGKAYKLTVVTYQGETPNEAEVEQLLKGEEVVPAGIVVDYKNVPGWIYQALAESGKTYKQIKEEYEADTYVKFDLHQP